MKDWPSVALGDIFEIARGGSPRPIQNFLTEEPDGVNWVMIGDASDSSKYITHTKKRILKTGVKNSRMVYPGDFLLTNSMSFGHPYIMKTSGCIHDGWLVLSNKKGVIDQDYFYHLLGSDLIYAEFSRLASGSTVKNLNIEIVKGIKVSLPPLEEQRRIAAILDKADGVRRKRKEAIRLTEELLKSTFLEMFGDPVTNPKGWEIKKLEEVTTKITDGVHSRPNYTEQGVPFISVKDITTGELKFDDCKFISEEDHKKYKKRCNPDLGDILYTKVGATYGRPALVNVKSEFSLYVSVCLIKPQRDLIFPEFLKEALATPALKRQADRSIKGIGVPDLHLNMIKDFIVPVPPIYKQKEFLEIASKIQSSKESLTSCSQESENLFNSLLQRAFRGEL
ncbi:Restriction modification system DNA specificity domain [Microcystis aeruginosa PCC 9432]|jgi:type I restriction enzyme S subunit|uniref:Restriction modification system DNA specificity domain n=1 Tax=Microcystis aeruginosa PCC 9432 TaxID=1160280 RepID=A0A822LHC1_MICAE|nr:MULTISPECIES: restriction endonuclease subunit S [Microcystis]TRT91538.1 MAG: restriction endonuclease subunit S [Microcystis aeruginosa Ma_OC_LR_19540900_S633]MCA2624658.1 restriction endonuclease subunit S [Microcystis sp. M19BS1]MCA2634728.1 restriction endonuclease subunit S [Microcystis sp. M20BS1]MCZ8241312.1 restriction endonuclease subunit S [Microcystis sp. LE19-131.1A]ROH92230.1 restriction endonuclease subunit S [Microcystis aeruginosa FACHB-524]